MEKSIDFNFVADIYDDYVNVDFDIDWYKKLCSGHDKILELMCGTGRVSLPLLEAGYSLTCVDYSEKMLEVFRKKLKKTHLANLICADICELELNQRFDLIILPFNSFTEITNKLMQEKALRAVYNHLTDKGIFFLTFYNPKYRIKSCDGVMRQIGSFDIEANTTVKIFCQNIADANSSIIKGTQIYEIYKDNKLEEKKELPISFDLISESEAIRLVNHAGFKIEKTYGDYQGSEFTEDSMFMNLQCLRK